MVASIFPRALGKKIGVFQAFLLASVGCIRCGGVDILIGQCKIGCRRGYFERDCSTQTDHKDSRKLNIQAFHKWRVE